MSDHSNRRRKERVSECLVDTVRAHRCAKKKEDRESAPVCNEEGAVSAHRQQEKEGSVRVHLITIEELTNE